METTRTVKSPKFKTDIKHLKEICLNSNFRKSEQSLKSNKFLSSCRLTTNQNIDLNILSILFKNKTEFESYLQLSLNKQNQSLLQNQTQKTKMKGFQKGQIRITTKNNTKLQLVKSKNKLHFNNVSRNQDHLLTLRRRSSHRICNPILNIFKQNTICLDDHFSLARIQSSAVFVLGKLYLFGGQGGSNFPLFYLEKSIWKKFKTAQNNHPVLLSNHTGQASRNLALWIGGLINRRDQQYNKQILITNVDTGIWSKLYWGFSIKCHASTIFGNMLIIHGGLNQFNQRQSTFHFITLDYNNPIFSKVQLFDPYMNPIKMSHHKICNTYEIDPSFRTKIEIQGIISYGGFIGNDRLTEDVYYIKMYVKGRQNLVQSQQKQSFGWERLQVKGQRPRGRYKHTFNLIPKKAVCILFGGVNQEREVLNDLWAFEICGLFWTRINHSYFFLQKGLAGHSAANDSDTLMIMGGYDYKGLFNDELYRIEFIRKERKGIQLRLKDQITTFREIATKHNV